MRTFWSPGDIPWDTLVLLRRSESTGQDRMNQSTFNVLPARSLKVRWSSARPEGFRVVALLVPSATHCLIHVFSPLAAYSVIYPCSLLMPTSCSGIPKCLLILIHGASFIHSLSFNHLCSCSLLSPFTHPTNIYWCQPPPCTVPGSDTEKAQIAPAPWS